MLNIYRLVGLVDNILIPNTMLFSDCFVGLLGHFSNKKELLSCEKALNVWGNHIENPLRGLSVHFQGKEVAK
jgi:hypothetical protein